MTIPAPPGNDYTSCTIQAEPARKLVDLSKVLVVLLTGEASRHDLHDCCAIVFLQQTGVPIRWLDLGRGGLHGNGLFSFLEKDTLDIGGLVLKWLRGKCGVEKGEMESTKRGARKN